MFERFKNFVLSTFAKNVPLIIKTSAGLLFGGALFYLGEGIIRINIGPSLFPHFGLQGLT